MRYPPKHLQSLAILRRKHRYLCQPLLHSQEGGIAFLLVAGKESAHARAHLSPASKDQQDEHKIGHQMVTQMDRRSRVRTPPLLS
jgi:hypothetical protein